MSKASSTHKDMMKYHKQRVCAVCEESFTGYHRVCGKCRGSRTAEKRGLHCSVCGVRIRKRDATRCRECYQKSVKDFWLGKRDEGKFVVDGYNGIPLRYRNRA